MTFRGVYRDGVIILDDGAVLREGTVVRVIKAAKAKAAKTATASRRSTKKASARSRKSKKRRPARDLLALLGPFKPLASLPRDGSLNVDHYLYGSPKRKS